MNTQFITDTTGNRTGVILSIQDYERLLEQAEDTQDLKLYQTAKAEGGESMPLSEYVAQRNLKL